jgi:predicted ribosomally synthesized peptide with nif11-like leader
MSACTGYAKHEVGGQADHPAEPPSLIARSLAKIWHVAFRGCYAALTSPNIRSGRMSIETALAFRDKINADPALREHIARVTDSNPAAIITVGAEYGFEFTQAEWYQASYPNDKDVLGSFELDQRSGRQK